MVCGMVIFPAIDLVDGQVVRLYQGDYNQKQVFGSNPLEFAKDFEAQGAEYLHLVDLDGAKLGTPKNFAIVKQITQNTSLFVELGGGIRDEETVEQCFAAGVGRVILGTAALKNPEFTKKMVRQYPEKIAIGVDARDGKVAIEGWLATSEVDSVSFCKEMQELGVKYIIYTDISRDGAEKGTNLAIYETLSAIEGLQITASGGVSSLQDVVALQKMNLYAAILGKALYTGAVNLGQAIQTAKQGE